MPKTVSRERLRLFYVLKVYSYFKDTPGACGNFYTVIQPEWGQPKDFLGIGQHKNGLFRLFFDF